MSEQAGSLELWVETVKRLVGRPTKELSLLDLCCGEMTGTRLLDFHSTLGVDVKDWPQRWNGARFTKSDVLNKLAELPASLFDVALCSDGIEHLPDGDGLHLITQMERVAQLAIIFTPLGPYLTGQGDPNSPDSHKSAWMPSDFQDLGWKTLAFPNWHMGLGVGAFFAWHGVL